MKPLANILCFFAVSTLGVALQSQPPSKKNSSFCGYTKEWPHYNAPDCKHDLGGSCLVDNNNCNRIPDNLTFITVFNECSCDLYNHSDCTGATAQSYDAVHVTDAILFGNMRYYKCHRPGDENGGARWPEVGMGSLLIGTVLAVILSLLVEFELEIVILFLFASPIPRFMRMSHLPAPVPSPNPGFKPAALYPAFPFPYSNISTSSTNFVLHTRNFHRMKVFGTLFVSLAGLAVVETARPAGTSSTSLPHITPAPSVPDHTPHIALPTPPHSNGWRSPPTSTPSSEDPTVENVGWFREFPEASRPANITVPLGVCQKADADKGVPTWANFIDIFGAHWCEFYRVYNGCDPKTDASQREKKYGPTLLFDITKYKGRDYLCNSL
ncbi:hypothetical protein P171DRAFT_441922 [Karstenula rhodostoma CBS 690.94]|uniref:Uncharacterized protein n=1 Tax=Karstenula rhodostoma CBS 690.94 TaxID=1392251 RepID=A0A9P4PSJ3_9PLEO|nr:hypothetical protein P171DRAFT_441922 [Karstenula rhodostoma CBS 690.94]